ncbi:MAG: 50S ribosomal protein L19 [Spirochaetales bacterium]|nr:50S ribosomal protein L19 [Spirochaetales bacterium]
MNILRTIENEQKNDSVATFRVGDTVKVYFKIIEGKTERIQVFEGVCIAIKGTEAKKTFTVRKISYGVGVERIFPIHSPKIDKIEISRYGKVRRSKLYYLRQRIGKAAKVSELLGASKKKRKKLDETLMSMISEESSAQEAQDTAVNETQAAQETEVQESRVDVRDDAQKESKE